MMRWRPHSRRKLIYINHINLRGFVKHLTAKS